MLLHLTDGVLLHNLVHLSAIAGHRLHLLCKKRSIDLNCADIVTSSFKAWKIQISNKISFHGDGTFSKWH